MNNKLPHLAQRLFNCPLAITPGKIEIIMAALSDRFGLSKVFRMDGSYASLDTWDAGEETVERGYSMVGNVAIIPVVGTLVQKLGTLHPYSGMTGYDTIRANLSVAMNDDDVHAIMFDIDSNGGEVSGCFDLVDTIFDLRGEKTMWSILTENAFSAAYAIASATERILVPRTGGTGSVGVICAHVDFSKALSKEGIEVTMITYGSHKADGSEYLPLSKEALERFQADVDTMGDLFVDTVARNRGMKFSDVRNTQAMTYMGKAGVDVGFADSVLSPDAAFQTLLNELG